MIKLIKLILSFTFLLLSTPSFASSDAVDNAKIAAITKQSINCIYSQTSFEDRKDCLLVRKLFSSQALTKLADYIHSDDNFQIAKEYSMVMSEYQGESTIDQVSTQSNAGLVTLKITTPFTLYLVKDNIEIIRSMTNTITLSYPEDNPASISIQSFTSSPIAEPKIIDHKKIRQVNCSM